MKETGQGRWDFESKHRKNAEVFIGYVGNEIAKKFPGMDFMAVNQTDIDLQLSAGIVDYSESQLDLEEIIKNREYDRQVEEESAASTRVFVAVSGDDLRFMGAATELMNAKAKQLRGSNISDSGNKRNQLPDLLERSLGHQPEHEDLPQYVRNLMYRFR